MVQNERIKLGSLVFPEFIPVSSAHPPIPACSGMASSAPAFLAVRACRAGYQPGIHTTLVGGRATRPKNEQTHLRSPSHFSESKQHLKNPPNRHNYPSIVIYSHNISHMTVELNGYGLKTQAPEDHYLLEVNY